MKTLGGEWVQSGTVTLLDKYGDYRVVEGVLDYDGERVILGMSGAAAGTTAWGVDLLIGMRGDYVKLILPPDAVDYVKDMPELKERRESDEG